MGANSRYDGKPLLRLLELYVLRAIGELPTSEEDRLTTIAPKLQAIYGGRQWHDAVAKAVQMPSEMPAVIQDVWARNLEIARANGVVLTPQKFAEMFVDENLAVRRDKK
jgi:hypothetical protein